MGTDRAFPWKSVIAAGAALLLLYWGNAMMGMPGTSHEGPLPPLRPETEALAGRLSGHVETLAGAIGERNYRKPRALEAAAAYIEATFAGLGLSVTLQEYEAEGLMVRNVVGELDGGDLSEEVVVIGAHYDSVVGSPGANDNASGVAALIEIARKVRERPMARTVRFAAFVHEEPPFFQTETMGSYRYARRARERGERIAAMVSLETIGFYSDEKGSQHYPSPLLKAFYPDRGNFIAFVSDFGSRRLLRRSLAAFRAHAQFPSRGLAGPAWLPGVDWSDQWAFWQQGYPGVMVTDTALFRYPWYHTPRDTPEKLDYRRMARVVEGLAGMAEELAKP